MRIDQQNWQTVWTAKGGGLVRITELTVDSGESQSFGPLVTGGPARFVFTLNEHRLGTECSFTIYDQLGQPVTFFDSTAGGREDSSGPNTAQGVCEMDELLLLPGQYRINVGLTRGGELQDHVEAAAFIDVEDGNIRGRRVPPASGYGSILIPHRWRSPG
jgi:lipopolysaccharide transport system ATP-binding protein